MNKRIVSLILALVMLMSLSCMTMTASAATEPQVRVNGLLVDFPDQKPFIENGRTYIPVRFVAEALGAEVNWNKSFKGASIKKDGKELRLPIGSSTMYVIENNTSREIQMDAAAKLLNGRTLVPIRFVAEELGAWVGYSGYYSTVQIYQDVLTREEVDKLHSITPLNWSIAQGKPICDELAPVASGRFAYENLNEYAIRKYVSTMDYTLFSPYSDATYTNKVDDHQKEMLFIADFIQDDLTEMFDDPSRGAHATFRTDASCISASTAGTSYTYINRGFLTVTFDNDANMAGYKKNTIVGDFGDIRAGGTYHYIVETVWQISVKNSNKPIMPTCVGVFNITNGNYVYWA